MPQEEREPEAGNTSIKKALSVLLCFSRKNSEWSMTELSRKLDLPLSTASRILGALVEEHFLDRDPETKTFRLGTRLIYLGALARESLNLRKHALPVMTDLRNLFGETVNLYIKQGKYRVCYEQVESLHTLKRSAQLGSRFPLWAGASGRCFLAFSDADEVEQIIAEARPLTANTLVDPVAIRSRLEKTRLDGYAISVAEREAGVFSAAAPIFDGSGAMAACLAVSGPTFRFPEERFPDLAAGLKAAAETLSRHLGKID